MMRRRFRAVVALGLLLAVTAFAQAPPDLASLDALKPMGLTDPPGFVAAVRRLEAAPPPADPAVREALALLSAQAAAIEGRFDAAIDAATPIADAATDPRRRIAAAALVVNLQATTRQFTEGQRRLETLLVDADRFGDAQLMQQVHLIAAVFYNQLSQQAPAQQHAEAVLASDPAPPEHCLATLQLVEARLLGPAPELDADTFADAAARCDAAGGGLPRGFLDVAHARWLVAQSRAADAAALLEARLPAIDGTGYARLRAEARAHLAEALQRSGRLAAADRTASEALALSAALPTGLPLLMAHRTRYAVALAQGDDARALRELQAVVVAERAYADEVRRLQEAYLAGRAESVQRQQAIDLLAERNAQLALEAGQSERLAGRIRLLLLPVALAVLAMLAWGWRSRVRQRALRRLMEVDGLTGLHTRAHFTASAATALAAAERESTPMALLLVDLDHFSLVNSRHGHLTGDRLLAAVGATLRALESPGRRFGRLGGEEFAVLLAGAGVDEGLAFAERCREAIAATAVDALDGETRVHVSASFGVVSTTAAGYRLRDLLANADQALYRAKHAGRNRVSAAVVVPVASGQTA